jgi:hypothetical protein
MTYCRMLRKKCIRDKQYYRLRQQRQQYQQQQQQQQQQLDEQL